jgi:23S rRNA (pseudouridine1915-N3)-methyltransferase
MRVHLVAFGKLRTQGLKETQEYYEKLIRTWVDLKVHELKALGSREEEADALDTFFDRRLGSRARIYLLDERGKSLPTSAWADQVRSWESASLTDLVFCIGGALGLHPRLQSRASGLLSLGPQTTSHELARILLSEQLYRAWSVTRGHPYHNP